MTTDTIVFFWSLWDNRRMMTTLLGGLSPGQFLAEYWQKKPLLVKQAIPGFSGVLSRDDVFDLACNPDVESRLVRCTEGEWSLDRGPFKRSALKGKKHPWTVLVQGVNLWIPDGDALLHRFDFIPQARLDDLMVSYAVEGGGVGPHFDHYDVFLIQGLGKRRWQIGDQSDRSLLPDAPLKILADFQPTLDWVLEPGDMLYLPPHWAHNGTAIGECMTYSVGFRSPTAQEMGAAFLEWMQERLHLDGLYEDPDLEVPRHSGEIGPGMVEQVEAMIARIRWSTEDVGDFLGHYLTEPKPHVFFEPPDTEMSLNKFGKALQTSGFRLDPRSILLFSQDRFYLNGERLAVAPSCHAALVELADHRRLPPELQLNEDLTDLLYQFYCDGFGHAGGGTP